jgi:hypothetical protein
MMERHLNLDCVLSLPVFYDTNRTNIIGMSRIRGYCPHFVNAGGKLDQGDGNAGYWLVQWVVQHL